jgi:uncharacterized HAD superfamily protein
MDLITTIALDLDDVVYPYFPNIIAFHNEKYGTNLTYKDCTSYELNKVWGGTEEEAIRKVKEFQETELFKKMLPHEECIRIIKDLSKRRKLISVTARPETMRQETLESLEKHLPACINQVYFTNEWAETGIKRRKAEICLEVGAKLIIEDSYKNASECADMGIHAILISRPWNQSTETHRNLYRVNNWQEVPGLVSHLL